MKIATAFAVLSAIGLSALPTTGFAQTDDAVEIVSESRSETAFRRQVTSMATCAYDIAPQSAVEAILDTGVQALQEFSEGLTLGHCLKARSIWFSSEVLRAGLARAAYLSGDLKAELPVDALRAHRYEFPDETPLNDRLEYLRFSNCVFLNDEDSSRTFLSSYPSSSTESRALADLEQSFADCGGMLAVPKLKLMPFAMALSYVAFLHWIGQPFVIAELS
ncbi:hypothetical protein GRI38_05075 [Altererythrobacter aurantiacus]|uniref:Uncharacterized protein n=1 Tax=Parapontixanthobacter aurantiacus TaxID=1463599 RepID=A0A844ZE11_9SPHN|nr:hypothetical protein [Parapontixanthobacter aurantiacus]MXO85396.1 hypothetical protein [Parapontixanthobacter aurantiacus]